MKQMLLGLTLMLLVLSVVVAGWHATNGDIGAAADVLLWPNLRTLTAQENQLLIPFATGMMSIIWTFTAGALSCFCGGVFVCWFPARARAK